MLQLAKRSLEKQLLLLLVCSALAIGMSWAFDFQPRLRVNWDMFARGIIGGILCLLLTLALHIIALASLRRRYSETLEHLKETATANTSLGLIGAGLTAGASEELLFRSFFFSYVANFANWAGYLCNAALMFAGYFIGRRHITWTLIKTVECSLYAVMYSYNRSLFMVATAHFVVEFSTGTLLRNAKQEWISYVVNFRKHRSII